MPSNAYSHVYYDDGSSPCFLSLKDGSMETFHYRFIDIVQKDSPGKTFGFSDLMQNALCYDLDQAVKSLGGNNQSSMDCIFRIGVYNVITKKFSNPRWMLVELKLNSTVARNDPEDLHKKVIQTERGLKVDALDSSRNFIYPDDIFPQKNRYFDSWKKGSSGNVYKNWQCFSPSRFEKFLLYKENLPYTPENKTEDIKRYITSCKDLNDFDSRMVYWKERAERYSLNGNRYESNHILASLNVIFQSYMDGITTSEEKELLSEYWNFLDKYGQPNDYH